MIKEKIEDNIKEKSNWSINRYMEMFSHDFYLLFYNLFMKTSKRKSDNSQFARNYH